MNGEVNRYCRFDTSQGKKTSCLNSGEGEGQKWETILGKVSLQGFLTKSWKKGFRESEKWETFCPS